MKSIVLAIWNQFIKNEGAEIRELIEKMPIIAAFRVKVTVYLGLSLSTKGNSSLFINPNIPEGIELQQW